MIDNNIPKVFTIEYSEIVNALETEIRVSESFNPEDNEDTIHPPIFEFKAVWDTGATNSAISPHVVDKLNLQPIGKREVCHAAGMSTVYAYFVNVILPNNVIFISLEVTEMLIDVDVLIGMDIISTVDFAITASHGKTKFTFQTPHTHDIDFNKKLNDIYHFKA